MEGVGDYTLKRRGTAVFLARLHVRVAVEEPKVEGLFDFDFLGEAAHHEINEFLTELAKSRPEKPFSISVEELSYGSGSFSVELMCETLKGAFEKAIAQALY